MFASGISLLFSGTIDLVTRHQFTLIWTCSLGIGCGALIDFALVSPRVTTLVRRQPFLKWVGYGFGILVAGLILPFMVFSDNQALSGLLWRVEFSYLGLAVLIFLIITSVRRFRSPSVITRQHENILLWGSALSILPMATGQVLYSLGFVSSQLRLYLVIPLAIFPVVGAYAVLRYRWVSTEMVLSRGILYVALSAMAAGGYALFVSGTSLVLGDAISIQNPYFIGLLIFVIALIIHPIRVRMQEMIDQIFFRGVKVHQERIQKFSDEITPTLDLNGIEEILGRYVQEIFGPTQRHLFILDSRRDQYTATTPATGRSTRP